MEICGILTLKSNCGNKTVLRLFWHKYLPLAGSHPRFAHQRENQPVFGTWRVLILDPKYTCREKAVTDADSTLSEKD